LTDQRHTPADSEQSTRTRLLRLKRGLDEVKLEALRRGYGLEPTEPADFDDIDALAAEIAEDVRQFRRGRGSEVSETRNSGHCPASSTA